MSTTAPQGTRATRSLPNGRPQQAQPQATSLSPVVLSEQTMARIQAVQERMAAINYLLGSVLEKGVDYDRIQGTPKPTLLQPGAQQIDAALGLHPEFEILGEPIMDFGMAPAFISITVKCRAVRNDTGGVVGEGVGSCNSWEKKYRYRREHELDENGRWRKDQRGEWAMRQIDNPEVSDLMNTLYKMAAKRAHIAATLNASGASRLFTQDLEDIEVAGQEAVAHQTAQQPAAPSPAPAQAPRNGTGAPAQAVQPPAAQPPAGTGQPPKEMDPTEKARRRMYAKAKGLGFVDDQLKDLIGRLYAVTSTKDMNDQQIQWLIGAFIGCEHAAKQGDGMKQKAIAEVFAEADKAKAKREGAAPPSDETPPPSDEDMPHFNV